MLKFWPSNTSTYIKNNSIKSVSDLNTKRAGCKRGWIHECGRSMVEMLGVLAIIGVLSIVGIQGYKKAMNKMRANELMNLGIQFYQQALTNGFLDNTKTKWYLKGSTQTPANVLTIEMDKPRWATNDFNIYVNLHPDTNSSYDNQTYHQLYLYGLGSCDMCKEVKNLTNPIPNVTLWRSLAGSQQGSLSKGIYVYCCSGNSGATSCDCYE